MIKIIRSFCSQFNLFKKTLFIYHNNNSVIDCAVTDDIGDCSFTDEHFLSHSQGAFVLVFFVFLHEEVNMLFIHSQY